MRSLLFLLSALIVHTTALPAAAETPAVQFAAGLGLEASSGKFGTDSTSSYVSVPFVLDWFPTERLDFELTVPLLYQNSKNTGRAALGADAKNVVRRNMNGQYSYIGGNVSSGSGSTYSAMKGRFNLREAM